VADEKKEPLPTILPADLKPKLDWPALVHQTKEKLAKILWATEGISDGARELALKEVLWELEQFQKKVEDVAGRWESVERIFREENELLRSLLGTGEHELRARVLALAQEIHNLRKDLLTSRDEAAALTRKAGSYAESNEDLRRQLGAAQQRIAELEAEKSHEWHSQMSDFSREQSALQEQFTKLNEDLLQVQSMLSVKSREMTSEKQAELTALQTKLLQEMEEALHQKEELLWAEEEIFARGVAQKLRGEMQSAMGRLQLTLEKFHLLEVQDKPGAGTWEQWWRLIKVGPDELRRGFQEVAQELRRGVETLEEYLALTHRRVPARAELNLPEIVHAQVAKLYTDRLEKGTLEVIVPEVFPVFMGDGELLAAVLQALMDNAFESLPRAGGRVRLRAEKSPDEKELWITVSDTGCGIPQGQRDRLFQPFFTTKDGHRGLGLARAKRYAEWHHGRLELVDSGAEGSAFRLVLPV